MTDERAMERALALALRGTGKVSPNPRVGCVIVRHGRVIAEGWHDHYGGPHAEVVALSSATEPLDGATLVVTLEPCNHHGKQPPCTEAIIATKQREDGTIDPHRGIVRVVVGTRDPNPKVVGGGVERLREAGIEVVVGVCEQQCKWLCRFFAKHVTTGMPYVVAKAAISLDGRIATTNGSSQWISGKESLRRAHVLRAEVDAVLIGRHTAERDDPQLGAREVGGVMPRRIVLDTQLTLSPTLRLFCDQWRMRTIVCCAEHVALSERAEQLRRRGVTVLPVPVTSDGTLNVPEALSTLSKEFQISSVLVEGGGKVLSSFLIERLVDELHLFVAPIVIGRGIGVFDAITVSTLDQAVRWRYHALVRSGEDLHCILLPVSQHVLLQ